MKPAHRRKARQFALQSLYQWQITGTDIAKIEKQYMEHINPNNTDVEYYKSLFHGVATQTAMLDEKIVPLLDRELKRLDYIERALLRLSTFELVEKIDVPYRVVINEGVELAKKFGATDSYKYVNGILDKLAVTCRPAEMNADDEK